MQSQGNKYHAQKAIINGYTFDSGFEGKIYQTLWQFCGDGLLSIHKKVRLFSDTALYPNGKNWAIDFRVDTKTDLLFVEAKGRITLELYWQLSCLELLQNEIFNKFVLVFDSEKNYKHTIVNKLASRTVKFDRFTFPQVMSYAQFLAILSGG